MTTTVLLVLLWGVWFALLFWFAAEVFNYFTSGGLITELLEHRASVVENRLGKFEFQRRVVAFHALLLVVSAVLLVNLSFNDSRILLIGFFVGMTMFTLSGFYLVYLYMSKK